VRNFDDLAVSGHNFHYARYPDYSYKKLLNCLLSWLLTGLQPSEFFGMAFWIGFSTSTLLGEFWLRRNHPKQLNACSASEQ